MDSLIIKKNISLSNFTTWRIGGPAEWIAEPKNYEEIKYLINWINNEKVSCNIIGAGSNLLINDQGIKGLSLCMRQLKGIQIDKTSGVVDVLSGETLPTLARKAAALGLHGLEWAVGIPGTIGGAIVMNAGAQGESISNYLESITALSLSGEYKTLKATDLNFGYRYSLLQKEKLIVVSARLKLEAGHRESKIREITNENFNHRLRSQPYKEQSCGCVFRNPEPLKAAKLIVMSARLKLETGHGESQIRKITNENFHHRLRTQPYKDQSCGSVFRNPEPLKAAKLIEELGLKGFRYGGAEISKIHSNFIINANKASSEDVQGLIKYIQKKVLDAYGILLETEVKLCGF